MKKYMLQSFTLCLSFVLFTMLLTAQGKQVQRAKDEFKIDLSGEWLFQSDCLDEGLKQEWFSRDLKDKIDLPGSMATNGKGNEIDVNTPWTGGIVDSSWFFKPEYARYRVKGNVKVPFWLQPVKYYKGAAWYQKTINIPVSWNQRRIELFIERSHWETTVWVDDKPIGMQNSLGTSHVFDLTNAISPGTHRISVRIDNRVKDFNVGENSHSISDHTQSNWNGMVGKLYVAARPAVYIDEVQLFPNIKNKQVAVHIRVKGILNASARSTVELLATSNNPQAEKLQVVKREIEAKGDSTVIDVVYPMGSNPLLWDEFHPNLYSLKVSLTAGNQSEVRSETFGMREFSTRGTQFTINGNLTFLRGTLECAIFPKTGYPPTDVEWWMHEFKVCRAYGLNHMRFHSWCPPEAAFEAADRSGFYLQIECSSWANQDATIGDGEPLDNYIYEESRRMVKAYGNHPSFVMMLYGNEPAGKNHVKYLTDFVNYWKQRDSRRLYTTGAGWPVVAESNYNSTPDPRIQAWGAGLKSIINSQSPRSDYDWSNIISKWQHPTVSHEIGQWCVYPDFKEISKYTGVLKAKNFEIFRDKLVSNGLGKLADSFLLASGKLQVLCYKADIEAALRTPGFGGFQLLDLHDFPGQGTALVGVLNPFWEDKGYTTAKEYSRFCNATVPLARLPKMVYANNEGLSVPVEIAHFGASPIKNVTPSWNIKDASGKILFKGTFARTTVPLGNSFKLGDINQSLSSVSNAAKLVLTVSVGNSQNSWDIFVYPAPKAKQDDEIVVTQKVDEAIEALNKGEKVLLTLKKGSVKPEKGGDVAIGFSSIFWNTAWTHGQAPTTLGILCNPKHPALAGFPTAYYSDWQWWDAMSHSQPILLDSVAKGLKPVVRVIDDWVTGRSLGLIFECAVGKGKLMVSGIDLLSDKDKRPEARQLLYSLRQYMANNKFNPTTKVDATKIESLVNNE